MAKSTLTHQGKPCKYGHNGIRYHWGMRCVECERIRGQKRREAKGQKPRNFHGYSNGGGVRRPHPLYQTWSGMIARCENPNNKAYRYYGGKGIKVCDRWRNSFPDFLADVGERPGPGYTLDRIDSNRDYEPSNVRWLLAKDQPRNRPGYVKLSMKKARVIRNLYTIGFTNIDLAKVFDVSIGTINDVTKNRHWKE